MEALKQFYDSKELRTTVEAFLHETLKEMALEKVFAQKDTKAIAEAKDVITEAFNRLDETYAIKTPPSSGLRR